MYTIPEINRVSATWFDLVTMPVWFAHIAFVSAYFSIMETAATHAMKRARTELE